jgi:hypothetical protein
MEKSTPTVNRDSKDMLAKLMASENIIVEHQPVPTAYFDVVQRRLVLPMFKDMDNSLYDMLVGHEVGHALFTPSDRTDDACKRIDAAAPVGRVMSYLNVVEDVRIEKAIKAKFPGIRRDFVTAYKNLVERDFFGIAGKDISEMSLIDRVNLHFKVGNHVDLTFSPEEQVIVDKIDQVSTWDEMVDAAEALYGMAKDQKREEQEEQEQQQDQEDQGGQDHLDNDGQSSSSADNEGDDDADQTENTDGDGDQSGDDEQSSDMGQSMEDDTDDGESAESREIETSSLIPDECSTQSAMDNAVQNMLVDNTEERQQIYLTMPDPKLQNIIIDVDKVMDDFRKSIIKRSLDGRFNASEKKSAAWQIFSQFQKNVGKTVNSMAQQFEMKKAADQYKRRQISDSGVIDPLKMINYRWTDDIFLKNTTLPGAKNHGMVMFVDWSGSMCDMMTDTLKQLMTLVLFCKKVGIPYEVYGFTNGYRDQGLAIADYRDGDGEMSGFNLINLISSRMKNRDWQEMMTYITMLACHFNSYGGSKKCDMFHRGAGFQPAGYSLCSTPLDDTIVAAAKIVTEFKNRTKSQIVNAIFLTDGGTSSSPLGGWSYTNRYDGQEGAMVNANGRGVLRDRKTGKIFKGKDSTSSLLEWFKYTTGIPAIGIFLTSTRGFHSHASYTLGLDYDATDKIMTEFSSKKCVSIDGVQGYDNYYVIDPTSKKIKGVDDLKEGAKLVTVKNAFIREAKINKSRLNIMNEFVEKISKETV